jgi:hypothetical protein
VKNLSQQERATLTKAALAELALRFGQRRCRCGAPVIAVRPGSDGIRECGILLTQPSRDRNFCLACLLRNNEAMTEKGSARQVSYRAPDRRDGYRIPPIASGATDATTSAVPVGQTKGLGPALQVPLDDVTGGPAVKAAGFPGR